MISEWGDEDSGPSSFLAHIPAIARQRKLLLIVPTAILFVAGLIAAGEVAARNLDLSVASPALRSYLVSAGAYGSPESTGLTMIYAGYSPF